MAFLLTATNYHLHFCGRQKKLMLQEQLLEFQVFHRETEWNEFSKLVPS